MTMLEDALRETFAGRVAEVPAVLDPAGAAIARARTVRRRQHAVASTALALAVTLVVSGTWWARGAVGPGRSPERLASTAVGPAASARPSVGPPGVRPADDAPPQAAPAVPQRSVPAGAALKLDLFDGATILTPDGRGLSVPNVASGSTVDRVPDGWLYTSASAGTRLMRLDGKSVDVGIDGDRVVVSADGTRVAWMAARETAQPTLKLAELTGDSLSGVLTTPVPPGTAPVALVGSRVVVASKQGYDYWDPTKVTFRPSWISSVHDVYGQYGDFAVAAVDAPGKPDLEQGTCVALLSLADDGLRDTRQLCQPIEAGGGPPNALSPDGRWLAVAAGTKAQLIDVSAKSAQPSPPNCAFPSTVLNMAWEDGGHLVVRTSNGWRRCTTDAAVTSVDTTARPTSDWTLVSRPG
jgi:hypothetical protein